MYRQVAIVGKNQIHIAADCEHCQINFAADHIPAAVYGRRVVGEDVGKRRFFRAVVIADISRIRVDVVALFADCDFRAVRNVNFAVNRVNIIADRQAADFPHFY